MVEKNGNFNANINVNVTGDPIPNLGNTSTAPGGPVLPEAKARGGPISANELYMVGEEGPELFMSGQAGRIIPAGQTRDMMREAFGAFEGGGGGVHIGQLIIQQLPGENAEALARRVVQIIQKRNR